MTPLTVFVPGPLTNPLNVSGLGVWKHRRWARGWRERTSQALVMAILTQPSREWWKLDPKAPKTIHFLANVGRLWDSDNLPAGIKPCRDGVTDAGLIQDDSAHSGHTFTYAQQVNRRKPGVQITITLTEEAP